MINLSDTFLQMVYWIMEVAAKSYKYNIHFLGGKVN